MSANQYASNNYYLVLTKKGGGPSLNVSSLIKKVDIGRNRSVNETTSGNASHISRASGLLDTKLTVTLSYDTATIDTLLQIINSDTGFEADYGPEGNAVGLRRHTQDFLSEDIPFTVEVQKTPVAIELSASASAAPVRDMFTGAKF